MKEQANCSCGQVSIEVTGDPVRVAVCHCYACQLRTGSAFGVQARFHQKDTKITGETNTYVRTADSGNEITYHFCPNCGNTVYYFLDGIEHIAIPIGAFANENFTPPKLSIYEDRQHPWLRLQGDMEHWD